jgi:hypothetical protein
VWHVHPASPVGCLPSALLSGRDCCVTVQKGKSRQRAPPFIDVLRKNGVPADMTVVSPSCALLSLSLLFLVAEGMLDGRCSGRLACIHPCSQRSPVSQALWR